MAMATPTQISAIEEERFYEDDSHMDRAPLPTDSMVSVSLSSEASNDDSLDSPVELEQPSSHNTPKISPTIIEANESAVEANALRLSPSKEPIEKDHNGDEDGEAASENEEAEVEIEEINDVEQIPDEIKPEKLEEELPPRRESSVTERADVLIQRSRSVSVGSKASAHSASVDWMELDKTEENVPKDEASDEANAFLLAQLEQANDALAIDPKSGLKTYRPRTQSRPPSVQQLRKMVIPEPIAEAQPLSDLPSPPPMTELEFWTALVQDYPQTAQRLPTLTSNKIRSGVPPPLRGVVWVSLAGARDIDLAEQFDSLCNETSPHEGAISKDVGRSFPGVEMFREADGDGQRMLSRVLSSFSIYDPKIGYCQGLGFLVGPLLMQMGEREAFCVLVRLMERYDMQYCFQPDLSGLHLRIYQFQQLLAQHMPKLAAHLDFMQVEAAYLSQWFLSLFAVTCPLPMLFRIYDVMFAEGAVETLMRVGMSLMRRNESRIMSSTEFEEIMQLLLSRTIWDPYGLNADDLVTDFTSFTGMVTHERLETLENKFKSFTENHKVNDILTPNTQVTASSFLGRLWLGSPSVRNTNSSLSPGTPAPTSGGLLRRTPSKQSMTSTLNSIDGGSSSNPSSASTNSSSRALSDNTDITRDSSADAFSIKSHVDATNARATMSKKDLDLHGQIEDLLMALGEMQREHALLAMQLQQEREEREEDHRVARALVDRIKAEKHNAIVSEAKRSSSPWLFAGRSSATLAVPPPSHSRSRSVQVPKSAGYQPISKLADVNLPEDVTTLVEAVDLRFASEVNEKKQASMQTKQQLRDSLARAKEQLQVESSHFQDLTRQVDEQDKESHYIRGKLEEVCNELQRSSEERERLEQENEELRARKEPPPCSCNSSTPKASSHKRDASDASDSSNSDSSSSVSGARSIFRLRRPPSKQAVPQVPPIHTQPDLSVKPQVIELEPEPQTEPLQGSIPENFPKRLSSLAPPPVPTKTESESSERDALLQELVNAKTGEAVARQELEELRAKMEALRRVLGSGSAGNSPDSAASSHGSAGFFSGKGSVAPMRVETVPVTRAENEDVREEVAAKGNEKDRKELLPPAPRPVPSGGGGFWGTWGKRSFSSSNITPPSKG
ncbi:MAG: hypothetical protein M1820_003596 [Bogoriella megaspora]|nr:MAG: hypothetical protein M1820_003596 [Bogoriella megaspora]